MTSILLLGLLLGMQHALEADHVAAVSSLCTGTRSVRRIAAHGAVWGLGHSLTLLIFAGAAVLLDLRFGETLAQVLEGLVGVMLILLGGQVLVRLWRAGFHFHRPGTLTAGPICTATVMPGKALPMIPTITFMPMQAGCPCGRCWWAWFTVWPDQRPW